VRIAALMRGGQLFHLPHFPQDLPGGHELLYRRGGGNGATIVPALGVRGLVDAFNAGIMQHGKAPVKFNQVCFRRSANVRDHSF
jgi:hypothetical protein